MGKSSELVKKSGLSRPRSLLSMKCNGFSLEKSGPSAQTNSAVPISFQRLNAIAGLTYGQNPEAALGLDSTGFKKGPRNPQKDS